MGGTQKKYHSPRNTSNMEDKSPLCAWEGPNYSQYEEMREFLQDRVNTRQGFKGKGPLSQQRKLLVITSINGGKELPFVTEILSDGSGGYNYRIHVDRLYHEYESVTTPEEGWPEWIRFH